MREVDYSYAGYDPYQVSVKDGAGNQVSLTTYGYTAIATVTSGIPEHGSENVVGSYLQTVSAVAEHWWIADDDLHDVRHG